MAGIGFELRKMYNGKSIYSKVKASLVSTFTLGGPTIVFSSLIGLFTFYLNLVGISFEKNEFIAISITYCFIFSMILTSPILLIISRYVSDMLYVNKKEKLLPSFFGVVCFSLFISSITVILFLYNGNFSTYYKFLLYLLFLELVIIWIESVYISILYNYRKISFCFVAGILLMGILLVVLVILFNVEPVFGFLISIVVGLSYTLIILWKEIVSVLEKQNEKPFEKPFEFIEYFEKYPQLIFINFFMIVGVYTQNFALWMSDSASINMGTFYYYPSYDVPMFFAFMSILPSTILFNIRFETELYVKVKEFFSLISKGGLIKEINEKKIEIKSVVISELRLLTEVQVIFSIFAFLIAIKFFPDILGDIFSVHIYFFLIFGSCFYALFTTIVIVILYFDDRNGSFLITSIFLITNISLIVFNNLVNINLEGLSFFVAGIVSTVAAFYRLIYFLNNLDYLIFRKAALINDNKELLIFRITRK